MAHTNRTANVQLPQFVDSDKPTWLGDFNEAMNKIDAAFAARDAEITTLQSQLATANSTITTLQAHVETLRAHDGITF